MPPDEMTFTITEDFFNVIELHDAPSRWEGPYREVKRGRTIERRRDGSVARDETYDLVVLEWPQPEPSWWDRLVRWALWT